MSATGVLIGANGVMQVDVVDLMALVALGYVRDRGNDVYEVTDEGRAYVAELKRVVEEG